MKERWKAVVGYEGLYEVSSEGRIKSIARLKIQSRHDRNKEIVLPVTERILKSSCGTGYYPKVCLLKHGKRNYQSLHSLVAHAFLGDRVFGHEVNHKDLNKKNPSLSNLEYVTRSQNSIHAKNNGVRGARRPVIRIEDNKLFVSTTDAAIAIGGHATEICAICRGRRKSKYKGWSFIYAD